MHDMEVLEPMFLHVHKEGLELTVTEDEQAEHEEHFIPLSSHVRENIYAPWESSTLSRSQVSPTTTKPYSQNSKVFGAPKVRLI